MSTLAHTIFNERPESRDWAIAELRAMGYAHVLHSEANANREIRTRYLGRKITQVFRIVDLFLS